jgi:hypothetical protein
MVHTGQAGPTGHHGCSLGQSGHFDGSHAMSFENSQNSVFGHTLVAHMGMKEWFARRERARDLLSDPRTL